MRKIIASLLCLIMMVPGTLRADDTNSQTNASGSNTNITGGYTTTNTYSGSAAGQSTSTTTNSTTNSTTGTDTRVSAMSSAPSMSAYSQDLCIVGISGGVSTIGLSLSGGSYKTDENCERIKLSKVLSDLGMKVASVSILCQDPRVFYAMEQSGTPCPFEGKIGKAATEQWKKYDKLRPDFNQYTARLKTVENMELEAEKLQAMDTYKKQLKIKKDMLNNSDVTEAEEVSKIESEIKNLQINIDNSKKSMTWNEGDVSDETKKKQ